MPEMEHMHHAVTSAPAGYDFWAHVQLIPQELWTTLNDMAPYLLLGFLIAGLLSIFISPRMVERHLGGRGLLPVIKAAALGVPLPLCSCGVIPVSASLRRHKASRGATTAFLISTPQTGVDSIMVTYSLLGLTFAIFRPIAALVTGIIGGALVALFEREKEQEFPEAFCEEASGANDGERGGKFRRLLQYGFVTLPRDISRALLIGIAVAGVIGAMLPKDFFAPYLGGGPLPILVMMAVGVPIYVCASASVPLAAMLIHAGVSPGAAFAFLVTGPATNAATIVTVWKVMGPQTAVIYLLTIAVSAIGGGLMLDYIFRVQGGAAMPATDFMPPAWFTAACAVALLAILIVPLFRRKSAQPAPHEQDKHEASALQTLTLEITGMHCSHCADAAGRAIREIPGVAAAAVDLESCRAIVHGKNLEIRPIIQAVESLGYKAKMLD